MFNLTSAVFTHALNPSVAFDPVHMFSYCLSEVVYMISEQSDLVLAYSFLFSLYISALTEQILLYSALSYTPRHYLNP